MMHVAFIAWDFNRPMAETESQRVVDIPHAQGAWRLRRIRLHVKRDWDRAAAVRLFEVRAGGNLVFASVAHGVISTLEGLDRILFREPVTPGEKVCLAAALRPPRERAWLSDERTYGELVMVASFDEQPSERPRAIRMPFAGTYMGAPPIGQACPTCGLGKARR